jgi:hypothetical protein
VEEIRSAYNIFVVKPDRNRPLEALSVGEEIILEWMLGK